MCPIHGTYTWLLVFTQQSFIEFQACARHCIGCLAVNKRGTVTDLKDPTHLEETD